MTKQQENPATVLIVNDDQKALDLFVDLLQPEGYKVFVSQSARRALEITSAVRTDIIICDVVMPEMNGLELCRRLKRDPLTATTPVLLASAVRKDDAAHVEGFAAGADDYIEIPFRHEQLLVKVARLIERCLAKVPEHRYGSTRELLDELRARRWNRAQRRKRCAAEPS